MKILSKRKLLIVIFAVIALFLELVFYVVLKNPIEAEPVLLVENAATFSLQEQTIVDLPDLPMARPMRLNIPKIKVDAAVEYVGLAPDGTMGVPKSSDDVAWFEIGLQPGGVGSAVISGHYGWKNGKASAFDNLYKLRKGDNLYIENDDGEVISFTVRESRRYDPKADASDVFSSSDGKSHLNLVTCEGVWDKASGSYSKRLVVFADKEME